MTKAEYKAQASQQRKQANTSNNPIDRALERNLRRDFRCLVAPALRKLGKAIRREVDAALTAQHNQEDALMAM